MVVNFDCNLFNTDNPDIYALIDMKYVDTYGGCKNR
jgi:hypothetical protein